MRKPPCRLAALLLLSACCFTPAATYAAKMASQPWVTNRIAEAEARTDVKITAATNAIPRADLTAATNYTDSALGAFAATGKVARATSAISSESSGFAGEAVSATWASRLSDGGSVGADNVTYAGILAGFAAGTNYTDAVAAEIENGTRSVRYANYAQNAEEAVQAGSVMNSSGSESYNATDLIRESTNAAVAVAASKQDALPYPTNAIPYAAISGAPSGGPEWRVVTEIYNVPFVTNGMLAVTFPDDASVYAITNGWPDGASLFVRATVEGAYYPNQYPDAGAVIKLVGYGMWPTNNFQSVWWRSGTNIFVNILLEE